VNGIQHLCAYYVSEDAIDETILKFVISTSLAPYMVPEVYIRMDALPLTPNGKVDRKALPELEFKPAEMVPAATRDEVILLQIAREMLNTDAFGVTDNLVDYGMTSISVIKFILAAKKEGIILKADNVLKNPMVRAMASSHHTFGYWFHPFVSGMPVFVFTTGFSPWPETSVMLEKLAECYNVFLFEDLRGHFDAVNINGNLDEIVPFYCVCLEQMLPEGVKVNAFGGHCLGGEIALRLASEYSRMTSEMPPVYLWDARLFCTVEDKARTPSESEIDAFIGASDAQMTAYDEQIKCAMISLSLKKGFSDLRSYHGQVMYFKAINTVSEYLQGSLVILSSLIPDLRIIEIDADHISILSAENTEKCLQSII